MKRRSFFTALLSPVIIALAKFRPKLLAAPAIEVIPATPLISRPKFNPYRDPDWDIEYEDYCHSKRISACNWKGQYVPDPDSERRLNNRASVVHDRMVLVMKKRELVGEPIRQLFTESTYLVDSIYDSYLQDLPALGGVDDPRRDPSYV